MADLIIEEESPPDGLLDDVTEIRQAVTANSLEVDTGLDGNWTLYVFGESTEREFNAIADTITDTATNYTNSRRAFDRGPGRPWLVQLRYE